MARFVFAVAVLLGVLGMDIFGAAEPNVGVGLTVYNDNFAVVKERRNMDFAAGVTTVKFTDVATAIDPTSVAFECLSAPGTVSILEQNYEYDLANTDSLLKRYIDKEVVVQIKGSGADTAREYVGDLVSSEGGNIVLKRNNGLEIVGRESVENISLREVPADLVTKPTLVWLAQTEKAGSKLCQVTYTTGAVSWKADYTAVLDANEKMLDLSGWVTIDNKSGAGYKDATIKLIAGDVRRVQEARPIEMDGMVRSLSMAKAAPAFEEKAFMEYHLYTLSRPSTVNNNQVKQIEFIEPALGVPVKKIFIYERQQKLDKVQIKLEFENTKENHLGIALPKGKVRVFKKDPADGMLEFVGEDLIDHTPRKEKLSLYIGDAFDIVPEYKLLDSKVDRRMRRETAQIELRNRKDSAVTVFVDEKFPRWVNWQIDDATHKYEKRDAGTARFTVEIPADSTATVKYTATQTW
ncbi:MAG: DUF4139 domain-containing protein [Sedimentisphaerales bacterium]|nr:DUF4139 domain-containing protein [Sedimentisphaerales bacterium]